ncbi:uncharacterized protein LOC130296959 isoform X2 [Hyla sarda]|uniref:uncharacterized protein LOC130296959 isoform X2 n=1 Tax=Hyla sarda TaxID=327740 RepID=UPI0024C37EA3|nr:uncharacterized protein LOC130296959 isoform X2 [Hyla sarda]
MFILPGFLSIRALVVALALLATVLTAPLPKDMNEELIEKIKLEAIVIKDEMDLNEGMLQEIRRLLKIFPAPLEQCKRGSFNQAVCYSELSKSLKSMHSLLSSEHLFTKFDLSDLLFDLQEFISNMEEMMINQGIPIPDHVPRTMSTDITEFQEKAGIFLILHDLCNALCVFKEALAAQRQ